MNGVWRSRTSSRIGIYYFAYICTYSHTCSSACAELRRIVAGLKAAHARDTGDTAESTSMTTSHTRSRAGQLSTRVDHKNAIIGRIVGRCERRRTDVRCRSPSKDFLAEGARGVSSHNSRGAQSASGDAICSRWCAGDGTRPANAIERSAKRNSFRRRGHLLVPCPLSHSDADKR